MIIAERLISRSSVALSVSIGYARAGGGGRAATRSRSPDDDPLSQDFRHSLTVRSPASLSSQFTAIQVQSEYLDPTTRVGLFPL